MRVLVLSHRDVLAALPPEACAEAMAAVLAARARGETYHPLRTVMRPPGAAGLMGLMPSWRGAQRDGSAQDDGGGAAFALKAVCIMPGNPGRGLDAHQGLVTLFDGESGVPTAILDASAVTAVRTAAVTAVATRVLARDDARTLAVLGAGTQARAHLRALAGVREFERVRVYAPTRAHAQAVVQELAGQAGAPRGELSVVASAEDAVPASPTTRISGSASSRSRTPRRTTSWSSRRNTAIGFWASSADVAPLTGLITVTPDIRGCPLPEVMPDRGSLDRGSLGTCILGTSHRGG